MAENIAYDLQARLQKISSESKRSRGETSTIPLKAEGGDGTSPPMDLITYRLDQADKRAEAADVRMARIEDRLGDIQLTLAGLATKDTVRNWGITVLAVVIPTVIATGLAVGGLLLQSSGNQLSAFQTGLSAVQTVVAVHSPTTEPAAPSPSAAMPVPQPTTAEPKAKTGPQ